MKTHYVSHALFVVAMVLIPVFGGVVSAQGQGWAPPDPYPPASPAPILLDVGSTTQIKRGALGIGLGGSLSNMPIGTGLYIKAGSLFVEYAGSGILGSWTADGSYAIDTNGRIQTFGITSADVLQANTLKKVGGSTDLPVCSDVATGRLKLCGVALGPVVTFDADPTNIPSAQNVTLDWSATNALSCVGTNFSTGVGNPVSGSVSVMVSATTTFTVTCTDAASQSTDKSVTVTVAAVLPTASITANPTAINSGQSTTISWSSTDAASCVAIPPSPASFNTGGATSGSQGFVLTNTGSTAVTIVFAVRCTSSGGDNVEDSTSVIVNPPSSGPTVNITASPTSLPAGIQSTTLTWTSTGAVSCTGTGGGFTTGGATSGSLPVQQSETTTYTVTCVDSGGASNFKSVNVTTTNTTAVLQIIVDSPFFLSGGLVPVKIDWVTTPGGYTSCTGTGFNTGGAVNGSVSINANPANTYNISCVNSATAPAVTSSVSPNPTQGNVTGVWSWNSPSSQYCRDQGLLVGTSGTTNWFMPLIGGYGYARKIECWNGAKRTSTYPYVSIIPTITSYTGVSVPGNQVQLNWNAEGAYRCRVNQGTPLTPLNGTTTIDKVPGDSYTLECVGVGGYKTQTIIVP